MGERTDNLQDFTRRRLLLQRFTSVRGCVARLEFVKQANVLNGDDRLIGKGLQHRSADD